MEAPKSTNASSSVRMILNPRWVCSSIYPRKKAVGSGDRVEEWGTFKMAWRMVEKNHYGPTSTGKPSAAKSSSRAVSVWPTDLGGVATVGCCAELR